MATRTTRKPATKAVKSSPIVKTEKCAPAAGSGSEVVVNGMAEEERKAKLMAQIVDAKKTAGQTAKDKAKATKAREARLTKLQALANGTVDADLNPNGRHNPQIFPESLRAASPGEMINDKPAKGWVVTARCAECDVDRLINTQDAFQVRFCKPECRKANKKGAAVKAELAGLSVEELEAQLATLKTAAA